jgi:hypothetical protein
MPTPAAILPGSFHPLHAGHRTLAAVAGRLIGTTVDYELSRTNVDKPELDEAEIERRRKQFTEGERLWVTRAATFVEKATLFPGATFVIGYDTAVRLIDPCYYRNDHAERDQALAALSDVACRVIVGGRIDAAGQFRVWDERVVSAEFRSLFVPLVEADFRVDVSSTELRRMAMGRES